MMEEIMFLKYSTFTVLTLLMIAFPLVVSAHSKPWPRHHLRQYPLITIFGPDQVEGFAMVSGVYSQLESAESRNEFNYLSLGESWEKPTSCKQTAREHGYIHTVGLSYDRDESIRVSVPLKLRVKVHSISNLANSAWNWPIVRIRVMEGEEPASLLLKEVFNQYFSIRKIQSSRETSVSSIDFSFDDVITTDLIHVPAKKNIRVRVDWSADGICDEEEFSMQIGDQIRLVGDDQ